jgi:proline dehydrogenase
MQLSFDNTETAFQPKSNADLKKARFLFTSMSMPWLTKVGISFTQLAFKLGLPLNGLIKQTIFTQFCGGETLDEANETSLFLDKYGISVIMDYGVEGKSNEYEFERTTATFLETIRFAADKPYIPFISLKVTGFARFELLEKIHNKVSLSADEEAEALRVFDRIDTICSHVSASGKMILIDAEESWIQQAVDDLADSMMEKYNKQRVVVFNTFQLYRHDRLAFLKDSFEKAQLGSYHLGAKLVRGAYMEKEAARAMEMGYPNPIQPDKWCTDKDYDEAVSFCLHHIDKIAVFIGTHNEDSCMKATVLMNQLQILPQSDRVYFSQLYGMSDNISFNLAKASYQVSKYLPYGPVKEVIPYLMRRAQENTSVAGQTGRELSLIKRELERRGA